MIEVKIYQTNNRDYVFMNWEWSEKYFNINDYEEVAKFFVFDDLCDEDGELDLEKIFIKGNNGDLQKYFKMRSISVSDVIEVDGKKYFVDSFGFKEVD